MKFGLIAVEEGEGAILGHTLRLPGGPVLKKGRMLDASDIEAIARAGIERIFAAQLEGGDTDEDAAAQAVARMLAGADVELRPTNTGRANLIAKTHGLTIIDREVIDAVNAMDESVTVATIAQYTPVRTGDRIATVKIIPFAVGAEIMAACERLTAVATGVSVAAFRAQSMGMISTVLPGVKESQIERAEINTRARLEAIGGKLSIVERCAHDIAEVARCIAAQAGGGGDNGVDGILILGASAIVDRRDVIPEAVVSAGGRIERFGMPAEPGSLILLGQLGEVPIIGVPGCARSLQRSGFDWVLERIGAGMPVLRQTLAGMGVGGLLSEMGNRRDRPRPVNASGRRSARAHSQVAAVILAAGRSTRMGPENKLLLEVGAERPDKPDGPNTSDRPNSKTDGSEGQPMIAGVVDAVLSAGLSRVVVVTGHEADRVEEALGTRAVSLVYNPDFARGMATSLRAGVRAIRGDADAVLVVLGDMPRVRASHIAALVSAFERASGESAAQTNAEPMPVAPICVPTYGGRRGNPVIFAAAYFNEICAIKRPASESRRELPERHPNGTAGKDSGALDRGARDIIRAHAGAVVEVEMDDDGVLFDIDTPEMLRILGEDPTAESGPKSPHP